MRHQPVVGCVETAQLVQLAHKGLDHAHAGQVLLHDGVELVEPLLDLAELVERPANDPDQGDEHDGDQHNKEPGQLGTGQRSHDQAADQQERCAHHNAQEHGDHLLHLGHIVGEAGDQFAGFQLVQVAEREGLHLPEERLAQIGARILGSQHREDGAAHAPNQADERHHHHPQPAGDDDLQVVFGNADVDDVLHQERLQQIHGHFHDHEQRRQRGPKPVRFEKPGKLSCGAHW